MTEEVLIAIELPTAASSLVNGVVADFGRGASVDVKQPEASRDVSAGLTFEPVSGISVGWFVLKIVGEAAIAVTAAIIGELIYKMRQEGKQLAMKTVRVRFPNGVVYNLVMDDPESMTQLQRIIADKAVH